MKSKQISHGENSPNVVHAGTGDVHINIYKVKFDDWVKNLENIYEQLKSKSDCVDPSYDLASFKKETLSLVDAKLKNKEESWRLHIALIIKMINELKNIEPSKNINQAIDSISEGDLSAAEKHLSDAEEEFIANNRHDTYKLICERAQILEEQFRFKDAIKVFERAIDKYPDDFRFYAGAGQIYYRQLKDFDNSKRYYEKAVELCENETFVGVMMINLSEIWELTEDYRKLVPYLNKCHKQSRRSRTAPPEHTKEIKRRLKKATKNAGVKAFFYGFL